MASSDTPEVSVIMGVYNQKNQLELEEAVNSILVQSFSDFEFIIYDDGSDSDAAGYLQQVASTDSRIRLIRDEDNRGLAYSLNRCIDEARGRFLARMDADDISKMERLEKQVAFLKAHPEYGWVGTNAVVFENETPWGTQIMAPEPNQYNFLPFSPFVHPSVMFRREIFEENIAYHVAPETTRCEDYELFLRLYESGLRGYNIQEPLYYYRQSSASFKKRTMKTRLNEAKIRRQYFPNLDVPTTKKLVYTLRPVVTGLIPYRMIALYKKQRLRRLNRGDGRAEVVRKDLAAYIDRLYRMDTDKRKESRNTEALLSGS